MYIKENSKLISFLERIFKNNNEFIKNHDDNFFSDFQDSQNPEFTILKCSDSRVQMESFDKNPQNNVFNIRNIGNQIITSEGSVDYGVEVLKTPFLLIIGHSGCGAVEAAVNSTKTNSEAINKELSTIKIRSTEINQAIIDNLNNQVSEAFRKYTSRIDDNKLTVIGAIYDFRNDFGFGKGRLILNNINNIIISLLDKKDIDKILGKIPNICIIK